MLGLQPSSLTHLPVTHVRPHSLRWDINVEFGMVKPINLLFFRLLAYYSL